MDTPTRQTEEKGKGTQVGVSEEPWIVNYWGVMMPELIPASAVALTSPVWFIHLLLNWKPLAAASLAAGMVLSGLVLAISLKKKSTVLLHCCVLLLVLTGGATMWLVEH